MTNVFDSVRDYSLALFGALVAAGLDEKQAIDCARNTAGPLAQLDGLSVYAVIVERLERQRGFGLVASARMIDAAACGCAMVPRFRESLDCPEVDEPACGDVVTGTLHQRMAALPTEQRQGAEGWCRLAQMGGVK